ncbi:phospholipid-transporting ATPase ID-like [Terrapene carolina triunguis]|uniref:phospholipid-transporting ATPase ID-like n=1 Tax=Terrapene triunguis TaxID=2587831 RepID=UPI0011561C5C|nr:phospholipid-transporting ATPase ID-like [Terrapene carolina triunguis]
MYKVEVTVDDIGQTEHLHYGKVHCGDAEHVGLGSLTGRAQTMGSCLIFSITNNSIKTSKYNFFTFLPLNLFEQFQRIANAYFLFLLILQLIPQVSSLSWFTTVVPLVLVLTVSGAKDAIDDFNRHKSDNHVNNRPVQVLINGRLKDDKWMNIQVGDIIKLENNNFVTADLLLLSSSEPHSLTYIETAELDGETNLKVKQALTVTAELGENLQKLTDFNGEVKCEAPNNKLDKFTGTLTLHGEKFALDNEKMLLRGCTIRNTEWCFGLVIYAGPDTKLMQNCGKTTFKRTSIDRLMNVLVLVPKFMFYDHSLVEAVKLDDAATHRFFRLLSLCHTVMPEEKKAGNLVYQAQSPDEGALVTAARNFGFVFRARTPETITVVEMGETKVYELLAILDFNNVRKRMSVIVRSPEGDLTLYCKGADTIVYELLDASCESLKEETMEHLNEFAGEGLRTLVVAYKNLQEDYFEEWHKRHHEASTALDEREEKLSELYEEIEKDLMLLGATAIEDKLQDGVPQTIETLAKAHIKIWVLTGDKQETAVNIGYSCNMLHDDMKDVFIIEGHTSEAVLDELRTARKKMNPDSFLDSDEINIKFENPSMKSRILPEEQANGVYGLVINGHSLAYALEGNLELELVRTACMCKVVICCRVTPLQKAQVVELVKKYKKAVTLAIGDGANDVSMIKTAHIGVGISGQEGMQAVLSSDFSFAQFRYLQRLLLVHGRWSYIRMCKFLRYFFYKNFAFTLVHFWYGFFSGFSAQTVYDQWFITLYNLVYTSLPVLGMSLFDQDVDDRWSMQFPHLYEPGQQNLYFNKIEFVKCVLHGIYSSLILFFIPYGAMYDAVRSDGKAIADYQSFALMAQTCLLIVVSVQIGLDTAYWTAVNQFFIWGSLSVYFAIIFTMYSDGMYLIFTASFPFIGTARNTLSQPNVWLAIFLSIILCVLPVVGGRFLKAQLMPTVSDKVLRKIRAAKKRPPPPLPKTRLRRTSTRRSGYAFSHQHGFGALIMSGRNMRPKLPFTTTGTFSPNSEKNKHK